MEQVPGTASSRLRAFNRSGETYCKSRVVSCGSCFSIFLKTCERRLCQWILATCKNPTDSIVDIPSPVKHRGLAIRSVCSTSLPSLVQLSPIRLNEGDLAGSGRSLQLKHYTRSKMSDRGPPTASIISCRGSNTATIPSGFLSVKYNLEASSRPSCHNSCHRIATRMSS